jgi:hypothetical protein
MTPLMKFRDALELAAADALVLPALLDYHPDA